MTKSYKPHTLTPEDVIELKEQMNTTEIILASSSCRGAAGRKRLLATAFDEPQYRVVVRHQSMSRTDVHAETSSLSEAVEIYNKLG